MINLENDNVITLEDGSKYYIKENIILDNTKYLICILLDNEENVTKIYKVFKVINDSLLEENDEEILSNIMNCLTL